MVRSRCQQLKLTAQMYVLQFPLAVLATVLVMYSMYNVKYNDLFLKYARGDDELVKPPILSQCRRQFSQTQYVDLNH